MKKLLIFSLLILSLFFLSCGKKEQENKELENDINTMVNMTCELAQMGKNVTEDNVGEMLQKTEEYEAFGTLMEKKWKDIDGDEMAKKLDNLLKEQCPESFEFLEQY